MLANNAWNANAAGVRNLFAHNARNTNFFGFANASEGAMRNLSSASFANPFDFANGNLLGLLFANKSDLLNFTLTSFADKFAGLVANSLGARLTNPLAGLVANSLGDLFANELGYANRNLFANRLLAALEAADGLGFAGWNPNFFADNAIRSLAANSGWAATNHLAATGARIEFHVALATNSLGVRTTRNHFLSSFPVATAYGYFTSVRNLLGNNLRNVLHDRFFNGLTNVDHNGLGVVFSNPTSNVVGYFLLVRFPNRATYRVVYNFGFANGATNRVANSLAAGFANRATNGVLLRRVVDVANQT